MHCIGDPRSWDPRNAGWKRWKLWKGISRRLAMQWNSTALDLQRARYSEAEELNYCTVSEATMRHIGPILCLNANSKSGSCGDGQV
jgi:hypothetical protein